jgi:predicted unusual protein kinase regulating ubiquinone biosynthesis (AarF/ABC1/UbiB family)
VWHDGRDVAVKVQYPGAGEALLSDLAQLSRFARLLGPLVPGMDIKPLISELRDRVSEELDYELEAQAQREHAAEFADDPAVLVPDVVHQSDQVLVTEWIDGIPLADVISGGTDEERDRAGQLLAHFLFSGPARTGLLHADPHPGNFRLLPDGQGDGWRLGVMDFGTVDRLPGGLPDTIGECLRMTRTRCWSICCPSSSRRRWRSSPSPAAGSAPRRPGSPTSGPPHISSASS